MLEGVVRKIFRVGDLTVHLSGRTFRAGDGTGRPVVVRIGDRTARGILFNPEMAVGEGYMDGDVVLEQGDVWDFFELIGRNDRHDPVKPRGLADYLRRWTARRIATFNDRIRAKKNVAHHYDLSNDLYRRFLDEDMQYSCAYFARPDMTLEEAQAAKRAHICAKLRLEPGMKVLDIGCGWGGLGLEMAGKWRCEVHGVTLSEEQLKVAQQRARDAGLADRAKFSLTDYREVVGPFDRIVSVGMFEHVGVPNYPAFFGQVRRLLAEDGVALLHSIGRRGPPGETGSWMQKYIFPGGYIPSLSEVFPATEDSGLMVTDVEILRLHYAETLKAWRARFTAQREAIAEIYDERFCRMWEFYLAAAERSFRYMGHMIFQMQLTKRVDALPITRDYMVDIERAGPAKALQAAE